MVNASAPVAQTLVRTKRDTIYIFRFSSCLVTTDDVVSAGATRDLDLPSATNAALFLVSGLMSGCGV